MLQKGRVKLVLPAVAIQAVHSLSQPVCRGGSSTIHMVFTNCTVQDPVLLDANSFGIKIGVGGAGDLCVVPSTVVDSVFLTAKGICNEDQLTTLDGVRMSQAACRSRRGAWLDTGIADVKASANEGEIQGLANINKGWLELGNKITQVAHPTLILAQQEVPLTVGLITEGQMSTNSHLSLAGGSTLLAALVDKGLIGSKSWGFYAGSQSVTAPRTGSLVLGGYDENALAGKFYDYNVGTQEKVGDRWCPLQVKVTGLSIKPHILKLNNSQPEPTEQILVDKSGGWPACLEPYDSLFRLPSPILTLFTNFLKEKTGHQEQSVKPTDYQNSLLNIEPGLVYPSSIKDLNVTLRITITDLSGGQPQTVEIPFHELQRPLRGLDSKGVVVSDNNYTEIQIYKDGTANNAAVLGRAFLSQLYLYVNYDRHSFHLASINPAVAPPSIVSTDCATISPGKLSPEAVGLIVVGCVLGLLIIVLIALKYRKGRTPTEPANSGALPAPHTETGGQQKMEENPQQGPIEEAPAEPQITPEEGSTHSHVSSKGGVEPADPLAPLVTPGEMSNHTTTVTLKPAHSEFRGGGPGF